ncbi:1-acyl-sn-glycerol-3-phosphate acyltransferase [Robiginitalea sp. SC105]|uniref:1-acyl-sn-glycerol-3-phosphate acyltransferase n=1 Tax=Robiginitalea sp. SC105 TaxID=2762332 RepID=UPI00163B4BD8|nr:1-acyl-sn-glycerol-3-phosphate acyltransferase [Robiginitalea sp. SC105]MBC2839916.1 1-acyl-sn-glycerol-3-phosphate acyltransferase [Robiginitalea sp. SC105]
MKKLFYSLLKPLIRFGFFCYYQEVRMHGMEQIPDDRPVVFLPNHQNALLDPLLIAAYIRGSRPYFLTRSDVFRGGVLGWIFDALRMIPIYRLRDGRETLSRNQEIFDRCASLLGRGEQLLLFPEANHNLRRQVRPLSKGFTRIVIHTLRQNPETDLVLLPVGINYHRAAGFPDRVAFYFDAPIQARPFLSAGDANEVPREMKKAVSRRLRKLTTHIPPERNYEETLATLESGSPDWLQPGPVNKGLQGGDLSGMPRIPGRSGIGYRIWESAVRLLNFPAWILWRWIARNKVWEPEFMSTFRFLYALLAFPVYLALIALAIRISGADPLYYWSLAGLFLFNLAYVKYR